MSASTTKADANSSQQPTQQKQTPQVLEEDDEFEDFPVEDWSQEETEQGQGSTAANGTNNTHLWEESWDDDDESEDFSKQLREEMKKVEGAK
ncbi:hypothetical protein UA08_04472 [Talaromyces atroroseus]|uniref:26S proteasome complex subunit SEM1 n=1 Tax=Talaromyces atroroseus TaxID=1441469 RepID=A0A225ANV5_TALAT|nr:hypothetical protein UA08_04472 [Talaromyces atroroseus]OKL60064.1 hypothetical protein UA08_04472 [Talaromyces atroroseus]